MKTNILDIIDFDKVDTLLEGFNKSTGFVTAILDLNGKVLSKSGWRQMCTDFHRINPETSKKCTISDTELASKMAEGEKYHFYKCLNGLVDVAVPIVIQGEHIANLFSGQFFFEKPDPGFFKKQAETYGFDEEKYLNALEKVPVVSKEKVKTAMDFLLNMTQLISETIFQKLEQAELNAALKKSEEKFKSVFESANVGKSITLPTGEIQVNEAFCKMLGYTREELQNKKWQDLTPEDEIAVTQKILDPLLKGKKESARFEKRYICKNGSHIWADVNTSIQYGDKGKPLFFITTVIDITEQKQAEEVVKESEGKFKSSFHTNPAAQAILSLDGTFVESNDAFSKLVGYKREQIIGSSVVGLGLLSLEEREKLAAHAKDSGGTIRNAEVIFTAQDGSFRNILYSTEQLSLNGIPHRLSMGIDISDRKKAEKSLVESEKRYRSLFENMNAGFEMFEVVQDEQGVPVDLIILAANEEFEKTTGLNLRDSIGKRLTQVLPGIEKDRADWIGTFSKVALTGEDTQFEQSSELLGYSYSISAFQVGPKQCAVTFVDITERKKAEDELRKSEVKFKAVAELSPIAIYASIGEDQKGTYINEDFYKIFGYSLEDVPTFRDWWIKALPDEKYRQEVLDQWVYNIEQAEKNNTDADALECFCTCKDGSEKVMAWVGKTIADEFWAFGYDYTERKQAEEELKKAQEIAHIGNWRLDFATNKVVWSEELYKIYGFDPKLPPPLLNESNTMFTKESWELLSTSIAETGESGIPYEIELEIIRKDGSQGWMWARGEAIFDKADKIVGLWGAVQDITQRKNTEKALQKSNERIRAIFEEAPLGIALIDSHTGQILEVNTQYAEIVGRKRQEMLSLDWMKITHPDDVKKDMDKMALLIAGDVDGFEMEKRYIHTNGSLVWVNLTVKKVSFSDGTKPTHLAIIENITERRLTEIALRESEEKFRNLMEGMPLPICLVDKEGDITFRNNQFNKFFGYSEIEIPNLEAWWKHAYPDKEYRKRVIENWESAVKNAAATDSEIKSEEYKVTCKDGTTCDIIVSGFTMEENFLATFIDITERNLSESELRKHREHLEELVNERTIELATKNEELERMNKLFVGRELRMAELKKRMKKLEDEKDV